MNTQPIPDPDFQTIAALRKLLETIDTLEQHYIDSLREIVVSELVPLEQRFLDDMMERSIVNRR